MFPLATINLPALTVQQPINAVTFTEAIKKADAVTSLKTRQQKQGKVFKLLIEDEDTGWQYQLLNEQGQPLYLTANDPVPAGTQVHLVSGADIFAYLQAIENAKKWVKQVRHALQS